MQTPARSSQKVEKLKLPEEITRADSEPASIPECEAQGDPPVAPITNPVCGELLILGKSVIRHSQDRIANASNVTTTSKGEVS